MPWKPVEVTTAELVGGPADGEIFVVPLAPNFLYGSTYRSTHGFTDGTLNTEPIYVTHVYRRRIVNGESVRLESGVVPYDFQYSYKV